MSYILEPDPWRIVVMKDLKMMLKSLNQGLT